MAWIFSESGYMSGDRSLGSICRSSRFELLLAQLHSPLQSDAALMDPIDIGESQVLLVVEYLRCGQVAMLLLYYNYKLKALMPQATALLVGVPVSANNHSTFVTFTKLNCEQPSLVWACLESSRG